METGVENGKLMAYLARHGEILSKQYHGLRVTFHCRLPHKYLGRIRGDDVSVTLHDDAQDPTTPELPAQETMNDTGADAIEDVA